MEACVLVVDDDREIVQAIALLLEKEGYRVLRAYNGLEALELACERSVQLILLDVIAELGIHERFITISTAVLHVFCPQELFSDSVTEQLFTDVIIIRHPFSGCGLLCRREKLFCKDSIGVIFIKRPGNA